MIITTTITIITITRFFFLCDGLDVGDGRLNSSIFPVSPPKDIPTAVAKPSSVDVNEPRFDELHEDLHAKS